MLQKILNEYKSLTIQEQIYGDKKYLKLGIIYSGMFFFLVLWFVGFIYLNNFILGITSTVVMAGGFTVFSMLNASTAEKKHPKYYKNRFRFKQKEFEKDIPEKLIQVLRKNKINDFDILHEAINHKIESIATSKKILIGVLTLISIPFLLELVKSFLEEYGTIMKIVMFLLYNIFFFVFVIAIIQIKKLELHKTDYRHYKDLQGIIYDLRLEGKI